MTALLWFCVGLLAAVVGMAAWEAIPRNYDGPPGGLGGEASEAEYAAFYGAAYGPPDCEHCGGSGKARAALSTIKEPR